MYRVTVIPLVLATALLAACGGSSNDNADTPTSTARTPAKDPATPASGSLTIRMSEFAFDPKDATAKSGKLTINAPNDGNVEHELVVLKTDADPAHLPMKGGEADESTSVGEIADVPAGKTKSHTFHLAPGKYAMVCNLPGHYQSGMYGSLTVK
jgi:uncharacterized cupredoxin-like copper-binding protein